MHNSPININWLIAAAQKPIPISVATKAQALRLRFILYQCRKAMHETRHPLAKLVDSVTIPRPYFLQEKWWVTPQPSGLEYLEQLRALGIADEPLPTASPASGLDEHFNPMGYYTEDL